MLFANSAGQLGQYPRVLGTIGLATQATQERVDLLLHDVAGVPSARQGREARVGLKRDRRKSRFHERRSQRAGRDSEWFSRACETCAVNCVPSISHSRSRKRSGHARRYS